jgi:hypothetical protein
MLIYVWSDIMALILQAGISFESIELLAGV